MNMEQENKTPRYMNKVSRNMKHALITALLFLIGGTVMAQNNPTYVIMRNDTTSHNPLTITHHFLAHPGSGNSYSLSDATTFDPATCIWYSGPNVEHNYYFIDDNGNYRYLSAPLAIDGALTLSDSHPGTVVLNKTGQNYYFYDWDHGVARGVQHALADCDNGNYNGLNENGTQCWEVVWVSYENNTWKMSSEYGYQPTTYYAQFKSVAVTQHAAQVVPNATNPGGAPTIADFAMAYGDAAHQLNGTATAFSYSYTPAYTSYVIDGTTYYFDANGNSIANAPTATTQTNAPSSYAWTLTGDGATYLTLSANNIANPKLSCRSQNTTSSHKMATLTLTVTYGSGTSQVTETRTATVTVKTQCQNPAQASAPVVTYEDVTLSWLPSADSYKVEWTIDATWDTLVEVGNVTSYTIPLSQLKYAKTYQYRVVAKCGDNYLTPPTPPNTFTTLAEPGVVILGAIYGGGRMADVTGNTEVVMVNCDSVSAVYGGNDIAGTVSGGSTITLGVAAGDANATAYNGGAASQKVRVFDVYGGGNGFYAYNGTSFTAASSEYNSQSVAVNGTVNAMTQTNQVGSAVWTNTGDAAVTVNFPKITRTAIVMNTDVVKVDSIFGGAKNAFITTNNDNGSAITINGGTAYAVFGGNNIGGGQGYGKHHIEVYGTKTNTTTSEGLGRDFGIGYLFGGGNKVYGSTTEVFIYGGQCDTVFAGGNSASVYAANITVNCNLDKTISDAIASYSGSDITINDNYLWNGSGVYNVRTLFGGNNRAMMTCMPNVTLTSGAAGTVYGGGNAGDMMAQISGGSITFTEDDLDDFSFDYSTKVVMNSPTMLVDNLYGGCQMSNVGYSSWVQVQNGHVGTVYGGCNISGDVGSTRQDMTANPNNPTGEYQEVYGATYVEVSGGHVYQNVFAGSNGFYHCLDDFGISYVEHTPNNIVYDPLGRTYYGENVPTHNETHAIIKGTAVVDNNVYAGGNLAPVGFTTIYVQHTPYAFPYLVGLASVRMVGGTVHGDVYGGGRMASINGSNEVRVTAGTIGGALYGGNDRLGQAGQISNRVLPAVYNTASDNHTPLTSGNSHEKVNTYVGVTGNPNINTVYGGGNGAYIYDGTGDMEYCDAGDLPIQKNVFVDIAIDGSLGANGAGYIANVYGGGNGVYTDGFVKVFMNIRNVGADDSDHVGTIYGGNNMGDMDTIPDIILLHGNVNTVYGGCNSGAMTGVRSYTADDGTTYNNIGSLVHLRSQYTAGGTTVVPDAKVTGAVYGGCRMNGVTENHNTLVLVEHGNHTANLFGGSDISGTISGTSHVVVKGGTVGNIYGGGNGGYDYDGHNVYVAGSDHNDPANLIATSDDDVTAPVCAVSLVDVLGGQVGAAGNGNSRSVFGGGYGHTTSTTGDVTVNIGVVDAGTSDPKPTIYGDVYGGSALGEVNTNASNTTTVNILNGTLNGNVYGGGLGSATLDGNGYINTSEPLTEAIVNGTVHVNIGSSEETNHSNYLNITGSVFGGNNLAGTPKANVFVDVYRTAHTTDNTYPSSLTLPVANSYFENASRYALSNVYGGGNLAHYVPTATDASTNVRIHGCENTVQYVYGGGNAANVPTANVTIDGGLFQYVFGGGNGAGTGNPGANVLGDNTLNLDGGVTCFVFGGSNTKGAVTGETNLLFAETPYCSVRSINELYGGGNQAADLDGITLNIPCGTSGVNVIFGGARMADVGSSEAPANVVLNVRGGELDELYGGNNISGTIYGNVTLNLYGGTINKAFGGNNAGGDILGGIQVNVEDAENTTCPLQLNTVYGGGNMAAYTPTDPTISSPAVNVKHGTVNDAVYGGGLGSSATVNANPIVTIGDNVAAHKAIVGANLIGTTTMGSGNVYGGGDAAAVTGSTTVIYADSHANSQVSRLFGGGNQANAGGATVTMNSGKVLTGIYGGCNTQGNVSGVIEVNINGGTLGIDGTPMASGIFGGGYGQNTTTTNNVTVNIGDGTNAPTIYADVYGGSALGKVHTVNTTTDKTTVNFAKGELHGNLYGGGLGQDSPAISAEVNGDVVVNIGKDKNNNTVNGGVIYGSVFGANNVKGSPKGNVTVNVYSATMDSIFGGGNRAAYVPAVTGIDYPLVNISGGTVNHKVVGGGNAAGIGDATASITANPHITISGGTFGNTTGAKTGVYGGCNASGTVNGDVVLVITGGTFGSQTNINNNIPYNIHGGGYGQATATTGDVTVNYGDNTNTPNASPKLYGDLYGGSALGDVNTDASNTTTVNVRNGSFGYYVTTIPYNGETIEVQYGGNIYGGGLGRKADPANSITPVEASVNGEVHVNVGAGPANSPTGQADLTRCSVYGCNNANGSPQADVYVDVYQAKRTLGTNTVNDEGYSILNVYGGGNEANYISQGAHTQGTGYLTHVYVHGCDNTVANIYGGGNAADAVGTVLFVEGGRFGDVFGGGNGLLTAANIGAGGSGMNINGGHVNYYYEGCNLNGVVLGGVYKPDLPTGYFDCGDLIVDTWFFGANEAVLFGDQVNTIRCEDAEHYHYKNVYAGSRCADIYGDVKLTVEGGVIENLFGGSKGYVTKPAHIKRFPTQAEYVGHESDFPESLKSFFASDTVTPSDYYGTGGNIILTIKGGTIGNAFGGSDIKGNVDGTITVIIDSTASDCGFDLDMVYGGSNLAEYEPLSSTTISPVVELRKGHVNQNVFGGGKGDHEALAAGMTNANPKVTMTNGFRVLGNIYGGGEYAAVMHNTKVELTGGKVSTVYGGGKGYNEGKDFGSVKGNTEVNMTAGQVEQSIYGGGELASVGTFNDSTLVSYTTGVNAGKRVYVPTSCTSETGLAKVVISGGRVGDDQPYMPTSTEPGNDENGYVFCGGKGLADSIAYPQAIALAVVNKTYLEISGTALIAASAYGGSENGLVLGNTHVKVAGGQIGLGHYLEESTHHWDLPYHDTLWTNATTYVRDKNTAQINRIAGKFRECDAWPYSTSNYSIYDIYANDYESNGGSVNPQNGHSFFGNVFGGGSGYYPIAPGVWRRTAGRVNGDVVVDIEGGHILTCLYGGNEYTDVMGKVTVNMSGGTIGVPRTVANIQNNPVTCMLFGAGMGDPRTAFNTWTNVNEVEINITGGTIFGSVYGGGEDGHVTGDVVVNIDTTTTTKPLIGVWGNSNYDGNIFGGGRGFWGHALTAGTVAGNVEVNVNGGDVLGTIYGGGRLASVGTYLVDVGTTGYGLLQDGVNHGYITVNVTAGHIGHDVYGGSMGRLTQLDGTTENNLWPRLAMAKHTKVNIQGGTIGENVYGGSEFGSVRDSAIVVVDAIAGKPDPIIQGSVFGGGFGSLDYTSHTNDSTAYPALLAGRVQGHTLVKVKNGTIKQNVYGGGDLASVGVVKNNTLIKGITNVIITGGTIGLDTLNHNANNSPYYSPSGFVSPTTADGGNVFGGSKGVNNDPNGRYNAYGNVNHTRVTIGGNGKVWGSVYGGSADGHVLGNDSVFIASSVTKPIGTQGTSSWDGHVFGGGKGNNTNAIAGLVCGNTYVSMDNGKVLGNIYGGGRISLVGTNIYGVMQDGTDHGYTKVLVNGGIVGNNTKMGSNDDDPQVIEIYSASSMGSIYGGGKGDINGLSGHNAASALLVGMVKNTEVIISDTLNNDTHIYGIVFGGGEVANVGKYTWEPNTTYGAQNIVITEGKAKIHIKGGIIGGDRAKMRYEADDTYPIYPKYNDDLGYVYGGGEGISDDPDLYAPILESTSPEIITSLVDLMATVYETEVIISGGWVKGSVFGGGESGHVRENTLVTISGGQIGAGDDGTADVRYTSDNLFINPTTTPITNSNTLYGTTHWPFGKTVGSEVVYTPYDPVYVANGQEPSDGKSWFGNVFGGGSGWFPYIKEVAGQPESHWNPLSGKVWGNTHVVIEGGHVLNNVYGGNEATDIGGKATVEIKGGTVGVPRTKEQIIAQPCSGYVFGGGCGDPRSDFDAITVVDSTNVKVTGGIIYGSVYGGAEDGHVLGDTRVTVKQDPGKTTVIGCEGLSTADGNIFGGGRNFFGENLKAGRVEGNIYVTMTSGTIQGSIFGGGRQALSGINEAGNFPTSDWDVEDHGNVTINVSGTAEVVSNDTIYSTVIGNSNGRDLLCGSDESVGDIFGSGKGDTKDYDKIMNGNVTNTEITITGSPRIYGGVFGGGEMASIGYLNGDDYIAGTGVSNVTVGSTTASESQYLVIGTPLEYSKAYMNDNPSQWTIYEMINGTKRVEHTCTGNVYGGSQGDVDITAPNWIKMARSNTATVTINSGNILSSVFGGPEQGTMKGNANVIINGGTIGQTRLIDDDDNTYSFGGVYGGGYGSDNTEPHHNAMASNSTANGPLAVDIAGRVYGTATVTVNDGTIRENVFGGGEMASVSGNTTVNFYKGTVGPMDRLDSDSLSLAGNVYGGGKGIASETYKQYCNVNDATVTIGDTHNYSIAIYGDVYGGGADAHVLGDASVTITGSGTVIGTDGVTNYDGNVFGGGRGSGYYNTTFVLNPTCGRVAGNITVTMDKGTLKGTLFGGGRLALAGIDEDGNFPASGWTVADHGNVTINVSGGTIGTSDCEELLKCDVSVGDIFGSGKGDIEWYDAIMAGRVTNTTINITGNTTIHGAVFGGGEMAGIGYRDSDNKFIANTGEATITIGTVGATSANSPTIGSADEFTYTEDENPGEWTMYDNGKIFHTCTGNVFGGSQGDVDITAPKWVSMASSKTANVTINSGTIRGSVFGGSEQGTVIGNTQVTVKGGTIGTYIDEGSGEENPYYIGDVYGGGYGSDDEDENNSTATNDSTSYVTNATPLALAGRVYGNTQVDMLGGEVKGNVFGGSEFAYVGSTTVNMGNATQSNYTVGGNVYGGNNRNGVVVRSANMNVNAGAIGNATGQRGDVFGGGYGELTGTQGDVNVTIGTRTLAPTVYGDVYGGSAYGTVNDNVGNDTTRVNIVNGIIRRTTTRDVTYGGDVYGGGLGVTGNTSKGNVNGVIQVNIGQFEKVSTTTVTGNDTTYYNYSGLATIDRNVYGCNNTGGYPLENVFVNIYGTAHTDGSNGTPDNTVDGDAFALNDVFGGGNYADNIATSKTVHVNIFGCDNTIQRVFGGSDASAAPNVSTDIQGGRIAQAFGGGNGENRPANINGNALLAIHGGTIATTFAGSNQNGIISGTQNVTVDNTGPCEEMELDEIFCGGNKVDVYGDVNATITCADGMDVRNIYGGCNLADIKKYPAANTPGLPQNIVDLLTAHPELVGTGGNVNLTICGGTYQNVYGGSKGDLAALGTETGHTDHLVTIEGNVTVNIQGGTIDTVFGGCNINGDIKGKITVNVNDAESETCPLILHNVYGGGRNAWYAPDEVSGKKIDAPEVNILNGTVSKKNGSGGNVFGGGYGKERYGQGGGQDAIVTANPKVTIGGSNTSTHNATVEGNVYGAGHGSNVVGNPHVILDGKSAANVEGNVYGGGSQAIVTGNPKVEVK